jgi:putative membrane protein
MKQFNQDYRTELYKTIKDIEDNSLIEVVVITKARSSNYLDVSLWFAFAFMISVYTFLMLAPFEVNAFLFYITAIVAFFIGYFLNFLIDPLRKIFLKKERMKKSVEIMARAIFQKGGIHHTREKIGVLFLCSVFEKTVYILADSGAETSVPEAEWEKIRTGFNDIFKKPNHAKALIEELQKCKQIFNQYIPPVENDINELPDDLEVEL